MKLSRPIPFRWGRTDCVPEEDKKWTPYSFEATKNERHSNAYETGTKAVQDFKRDFNMTARETISLMAIHGLAEFNKNYEESTFYKWIGGLKRNPLEASIESDLRKIPQRNRRYHFDNRDHVLVKLWSSFHFSLAWSISQLRDEIWGKFQKW